MQSLIAGSHLQVVHHKYELKSPVMMESLIWRRWVMLANDVKLHVFLRKNSVIYTFTCELITGTFMRYEDVVFTPSLSDVTVMLICLKWRRYR